MTESGPDRISAWLAGIAPKPDTDPDLALIALCLARINHPGISIDRFVQHLRKTGEEVTGRHKALLEAGADDNAQTRLASLKHIIVDRQGIDGATEDFDNIENADLMRVIDTKRGMPIALAILYLDAARRQGWGISGLNLPGHFVLRLDKDGERIIFDPFSACKILQAADLRQLIKEHLGPNAELSAVYYEPATDRQILLRLQNNIKLRQIQMEDYAGALETVRAMRLIDPDEYRLLLDAGVLYARTSQPQAAIDALEIYLGIVQSEKDRRDAALLLEHIRNSIQ